MKKYAFFLTLLILSVSCILSCVQAPVETPTQASEAAEITEDMIKLDTTITRGYLSTITGNVSKDKSIWAHAEKLYNEFKKTQAAILEKGDAAIKPVTEDPAEFPTVVAISMHNQPKSVNCRTVAALKNFEAAQTVELDNYGGWKNESMKQEAKGYFYTKKLNGRWYFITPDGYPMIAIGTSAMCYSYNDNDYNQTTAATDMYGTKEKWAIAASNDYKNKYYFNCTTLNEGGHDYLKEVVNGVVYQHGLYMMGGYEHTINGIDPTPSGSTLLLYGMHSFDPGLGDYFDKCVKARLENQPHITSDPYFLGYTTDNELPSNPDMLLEYLSIDIETVDINYYSYAAAWTFLAKETGKASPTLADAQDPELQDLFCGFVYERYMAEAVKAIRKYDKVHLIMGNRGLSSQRTSEWIMRVTGYYCDVITNNWYHQTIPSAEHLNNISKWTDKPILITEFWIKSRECEGENMENVVKNIGAVVATQKERGIFYQNYTLRLLECQNVVGWHIYRYIDTPTDNIGIVSNTHKAYTDFMEQAVQVHRNVYQLAAYFDGR